jgi:phosphatidylglycerophosphate synthase
LSTLATAAAAFGAGARAHAIPAAHAPTTASRRITPPSVPQHRSHFPVTGRGLRILANALTLSRLPLAAAVAASLATPALAAALVAVAAATDALDGTVARAARRRGDTATAGDWLDPLADKLFVATVAVALGARTGAWLALALLAIRDLAWLVAAPLALRWRARAPLRARPLGKATTVAQLAALAVLAVAPAYAVPAAAVAGALGVAAIVDYAHRALASHSATAPSA